MPPRIPRNPPEGPARPVALTEPLPVETQTLYSELVEQLRVTDFMRSFADLPGTFLQRDRDGGRYWYFRTSEGPTGQQEFYIGSDNEATYALMTAHEDGREDAEKSKARVQRLAAMLRSGGLTMTDPSSAKIMSGLGAAGVFRLGGVLIGAHAFLALGNAMGVKWSSALKTQDVDFGAPRRLDLGIPQTPQLMADIPSALESLGMGFLPHVRLHSNTQPTSFVVRGQEWRVDLLTSPQGADRESPVLIPRLKAYAQPLEFMDYLLEKTMNAAIVNGVATLVRIPEPARFALHKLLVAGKREPQFRTKVEKDRQQAFQVLVFLQKERPGDILLAAEDLKKRGPNWVKQLRQQVALLPEPIQELADALKER